MGKDRKYLAKKDREYKPLCENQDIAKLWNCKQENIRLEYQANKNKQTEYRMLDIGTFCILNGITPQMIEVFARFGKEFTESFAGLKQEDLEEFKQYQRFKLFSSNK